MLQDVLQSRFLEAQHYLEQADSHPEAVAACTVCNLDWRVFESAGIVVMDGTVVVLCISRCATCSRFSQRIKNALAEADKIPLQRAQQQHINEVMSHRTLCTRLNHLSEESTGRHGISDPNGILKVDLDGADQSKTVLPRGLDNNKFLSSLWRAQLHVMGALVHGAAYPSTVGWLAGCCVA